MDISPIADLMKSEVYKLGEYLQIPQSILKAKPSDGLFGDDRSDEDQLKASYDELEWAMLQNEQGKKADDLAVESVKYLRYTPASTVLTSTRCNRYRFAKSTSETNLLTDKLTN